MTESHNTSRADPRDANLPVVLADVLKDYDRLNQSNIKNAIQALGIRNISVDRDGDGPKLAFSDSRTGRNLELGLSELRSLAPNILQLQEFFDEANAFLKKVEVRVLNVSRNTSCSSDRIDLQFLQQLLARHVFSEIPGWDNADYSFVIWDISEKQVKVCLDQSGNPTHVEDQGTVIKLSGASQRTLCEARKRLHKFGFNTIETRHMPIKPTRIERLQYFLRALRKEMFTIPSVARFVWTVLSLVVGFLLGRVMP